jgi:hypothetical protein
MPTDNGFALLAIVPIFIGETDPSAAAAKSGWVDQRTWMKAFPHTVMQWRLGKELKKSQNSRNATYLIPRQGATGLSRVAISCPASPINGRDFLQAKRACSPFG